jgi:hypothetical protein
VIFRLYVQYYMGEIKLETNLLEESRQLLGVRILAEAFWSCRKSSARVDHYELLILGTKGAHNFNRLSR